MEFESWGAYRQRTASIAEQRKAKAAAPPPPVAPPAAEPSYIGQRQQDQEQQNPFIGAALGAMENLARPGAAVRGFMGSPDDRLGGAARAFMAPDEAPSGYDVTGRGFGLPNENINPLPIGPRFGAADVAGRAFEMAADPLNFIPYVGPGSKAIKAPFQAAKILRTPIEAPIEAGLTHLITPAEQVARNTTETLGRDLTGWMPHQVTDLFSPRAKDDPGELGTFLRGVTGAQDSIRAWVETNMAPFRSVRFPDGPDAISAAIEGTATTAMSPKAQIAAKLAQAKIKSGEELWDEARAELEAVAPAMAAKYKVDWLVDYFPRTMVKEEADGTRTYARIGSKRGMEHLRAFDTKEDGLAEGFKYLPDSEALTQHLQAVGAKATEMRMLTELGKSKWAKYLDTGDLAETGSEIAASAHRFTVLKEFESVANRAIRGERVPPASLKKAMEEFPALVNDAKVIRLSGSETDRVGTWLRKPTDDTYVKFLENLRSEIATEKDYLDDLRNVAQRERAAQSAEHVGRLEIPGTSFRGLWLDEDVAKEIGGYFGKEDAFAKSYLGSAARVAKPLSDLRSLQAAGDVSFAFLQLLPALARDPGRAIAAMGLGIRAFVQPEFHAKWMAQDSAQETLTRFHGLQVAGAELGASRETLGALPVIGKVARPVFGSLVERSQAAWDMGTDGARVLMAQAMKNVPAGSEGQVVDFLNHATGVISTRAMGVGPGQRAAEDMMLFAPRYLRAGLALVGDTIGGKVAREESLKTLGSMMVAGAWWYQHVTDAMEQEAIWDPSDARFMTVDIEGNRVGMGGTYRSLMNLVGKIAAHPTDVLDINWTDPENKNPLLRFWRGRASVPLANAWDIVTGETYMGTPIDNNFTDLSKWVGKSVLPFAISGLLQEGGTPQQKAVQFGASVVGARAFPEGRADIRERLASERFGKAYKDLDRIEQAEIRNMPAMKDIAPIPGVRGERDRQVQVIQTDWKTAVEAAAAEVAAGDETEENFRRRFAAASAERRSRFKEVPGDDRKSADDTADKFEDDYYALLKKGEFGRTDFDTAQAFLEAGKPEHQQYVADGQRATLEQLNPEAKRLANEMKDAQEALRPYRDIVKRNLERVGVYEQWRDATPVEREQIEKSVRFKIGDRFADREKKLMRLRDPGVDAALVRFYGATPIRQQR